MIRDIFKSSALPIGLDLRSGSARLVQLKRSGAGHALVARSQVRLSMFDGQTISDSALKELENGLRDCLDSGRFTSRQCVISLSDALVRVRSVRQPDMPREEANRALRLEGAERLGFSAMTTAQVGWINAGRVRHGEEMREEVILVGCELQALEQVIDAVTAAGLSPLAIEPSFAANTRCFCRTYGQCENPSEESPGLDDADASIERGVRVILDVGGVNSSVTVLREGRVAFYKVIELGGADMNRVTAGQLGLDLETVVELRQRRLAQCVQGSTETVNPKVDRAIFDAVRPLMHEIAQEASMCLRYYTVTFCGQRPAFVQVVGEESAEPGLVETIGAQLNINTVLGQPLDGIANTHIDAAGALAEWSVATGLSLRGDSRLVGGRAAA